MTIRENMKLAIQVGIVGAFISIVVFVANPGLGILGIWFSSLLISIPISWFLLATAITAGINGADI